MRSVAIGRAGAAVDADLAEFEEPKPARSTVNAVAALLERNGIDPSEVGRVQRVSVWQGFIKKPVPCERCNATGMVTDGLGDDGQETVCPACAGAKRDFVPEPVDMTGVQLSPAWESGPEWPVVQPAKPTVVRHSKQPQSSLGPWLRAAILPDIQIGYYRDREDNLHPTHDESALDVAYQVLAVARPTLVVCVGDNLDFPELGKYRLSPAFARTTQATVDRAGLFLAEVRAAVGPDCEIIWLAGNHEERLPNYVLDNAKAAFGLRRANAPDSWPLLSVPTLVRTDDHDVKYVPGYPASEYWINDRVRVIHGHRVRSNSSTAYAYLQEERVSTIYGHVHRREWAERTRATRHGLRTILAASPGTLARIDGHVPSTKSGLDLDGLPVGNAEDWQQGLALVDYQPGDAPFSYEQVPIHDGWAHWRDRDFKATEDDETAR